jgi:phospholipid/cholesterol/gamma-HCH transport system substrate-binding protein
MGQNRFIILGLFVILAMGMFFYLAFKVGTLAIPGGTEVTVLFEDATGLKKGGDVKVKGVVFGKILSLDYKENKAEVKISLKRDSVVPNDVEARIRPETLLGDNFLELIIPPESKAEPLKTGDVITHASKAIDINQFVDKVGGFIESFESTNFSANLSKLVGTLADSSGRIEQMIENLDELAVDARELISGNKKSLERTIYNLDRITTSFGENAPKTAENLNQVLVRIEKLTADLEQKSPDLAEDLGTTLKNLSLASEELPETLADFRMLSNRLNVTLDHADHFFVEEIPEIKDILEKRGIKTRLRVW